MQAWSPNISGGEIRLPAGWDALIAQADEDLGSCGDACTI
jgi:hypothetical protein